LIRKFILLLCLIIFFLFSAKAIDVSAKSAILYEPASGEILYQKDIETPREIASTTKIMTAILALEHTEMDETVIIKPEYTGIEGTSLYLKPGEKISVKTLLYGLMLQSGNDAAVALAGHISGDVSSFVKLMNKKADSLGMKCTFFQNPNGLPAQKHYSTAYDMAKLTSYAMKLPEFKEIVSTKLYVNEGKTFSNHNKLLKMSKRVDGVKTGFTKAAGRCLVSSAEENGMRLVAVTLSAPDDWNDHLKLYDYGFSSYKKQVFIENGQIISEIPVINGRQATVSVCALGEISAITSNNQNSNIQVKINLPRFVYAPIYKSQKIGEVFIVKDGKIISNSKIVSLDTSELQERKTIIERIHDFLTKLF